MSLYVLFYDASLKWWLNNNKRRHTSQILILIRHRRHQSHRIKFKIHKCCPHCVFVALLARTTQNSDVCCFCVCDSENAIKLANHTSLRKRWNYNKNLLTTKWKDNSPPDTRALRNYDRLTLCVGIFRVLVFFFSQPSEPSHVLQNTIGVFVSFFKKSVACLYGIRLKQYHCIDIVVAKNSQSHTVHISTLKIISLQSIQPVTHIKSKSTILITTI